MCINLTVPYFSFDMYKNSHWIWHKILTTAKSYFFGFDIKFKKLFKKMDIFQIDKILEKKKIINCSEINY